MWLVSLDLNIELFAIWSGPEYPQIALFFSTGNPEKSIYQWITGLPLDEYKEIAYQKWRWLMITLPETNVAPENRPPQ